MKDFKSIIKNIKLSKKDISIITIFFAVTILFLFIYLPQVSRVKSLRIKLSGLENQILEVPGQDPSSKQALEFIKALENEIDYIYNKFPAVRESVMRQFSDLASRNDIDIISIRSSLGEIDPRYENEVLSFNKNLKKVYLDVYAKGEYTEFGKFLQALREEFDVFTVVDRLYMEKFRQNDKLLTEMKVSFYILSR